MPSSSPAAAKASGRGTTWLVLGLIVALVMGGAWFLTQRPGAAPGTAQVAQGGTAAVGQPAPDFTAPTLDGRSVTMAQLKGKPVWLTFGASWCQPCRAEAPDLQAAYAAHADKISLVSVYNSEDATAVKRYSDLLGFTFTQVPDPQTKVGQAYAATSIPVHFFIDASGVVRERHEGAMSRADMDAALARVGG